MERGGEGRIYQAIEKKKKNPKESGSGWQRRGKLGGGGEGHAPGTREVPGHGSNQSHKSDNTGSLTH